MRSTVARSTIIAVMLAIGLCAMPVGHCEDLEDPIKDPPSLTQSHPLGNVSVLVLYADEDLASLRQQVTPKVTALLTMTSVDKDEKCTIIVTARSPKTECCVVKTKSEK